ncbi:MAG: 50S ribosomal protein L35 [Chloroflexi bacterium]|nr:50S ribosomal protein L35 [Chloroflexota bacterium]
MKNKLKTHSGAKKRFRTTGSGKFLRMKGHSSHLRRNKRASAKRSFDKTLVAHDRDVAKLSRLLPYS